MAVLAFLSSSAFPVVYMRRVQTAMTARLMQGGTGPNERLRENSFRVLLFVTGFQPFLGRDSGLKFLKPILGRAQRMV